MLIYVVILSLTQGITEFLPISSSAHLYIIEKFFHTSYSIALINISITCGTLVTLLIYFWNILVKSTKEVFLYNKKTSQSNLLLFQLFVATIPIIILGLIATKLHVFNLLSNQPIIMAISLAIFGILLYRVDNKATDSYTLNDITYKKALLIGIAQCLALIPGVSRLGITITAARYLNINRLDAITFSFLLDIPTTLAAMALLSLKLISNTRNLHMDKTECVNIIFPLLLTFLVGILLIKWLIKYIQKINFKYIMYYRLVLAVIVILLF